MGKITKLKNAARREEQRENWTRAIELYRQALLASEKSEHQTPDLSLFNRIGDIHLRLGDRQKAVQFYEQAIDRYAEQDLHTSAIALCNKVLRVLPQRVEVLRQLGALQAATGLVAEARGNYLRFSAEMVRRDRTEVALEALEECVRNTADQEAGLRLAELFVELDRAEEARGRLRELHTHLESGGLDASRIARRIAELETGPAATIDGSEAEPVTADGEPESATELAAREAVAALEAELLEAEFAVEVEERPEAEGVAAEAQEPAVEAEELPEADEVAAEGHELPGAQEVAAEAPAPANSAGGTPLRRPRPEGSERPTRIVDLPDHVMGGAGIAGEFPEAPVGDPPPGLTWSFHPEVRERPESPDRFSAHEPPSLELSAEAPERTDPPTRILPSSARSFSAEEREEPSAASRLGSWCPLSPDEPEFDHALVGKELNAFTSEERPAHLSAEPPAPPAPPAAGRLEGAAPGTSLDRETLSFPPEVPEPTGGGVDGSALLRRGEAEKAAGRPEEAVRLLGEALASPAHFVGAYLALRDCRMSLGEPEDSGSVPDLEPASDLAPAPGSGPVASSGMEPSAPANGGSRTSSSGIGENRDQNDSGGAQPRLPTDSHEPMDEFREWVRSAPPRLLERAREELEARDETEKAIVVAERLAELDPEGSASAPVGPPDTPTVGSTVESTAGSTVGSTVESTAGSTVGSTVGSTAGSTVGSTVGSTGQSKVRQTGPSRRPPPQEGNGDSGLLPYTGLESEAPAVNFDELLADLKTSLTESASLPDMRSRTELAATLKEQGLLDEAIRELQVAVREPSAPAQAFELLGEAFREKGRPRVAARLLAKAVEERSFEGRESLGVLYQLGLAYQQLDDRSRALECYEHIFSVDIDYRDIQRRIPECAE